ncbi:N-acetyltransferase GCN5 [Catellatospora bangladeshensis]|uniref:N-acetyltransferase GCN5 n=1 Tax=Catellatospora bangladeshensis TaxID=310355 RepID=A0A8J3NKS4_9ACTN|nr:N-acetyltransferase GCN5 [Catellatospora bangladeshensis]
MVRLVPWAEGDLALLRRINTPEMKRYVGGPETDEQVEARHRRYLALGTGQMFRVELVASGDAAGTIGHWEREWHGERVYETGWSVLPEFQGRGVAVAAARALIEVVRAEGRHRWLHAYPGVDNTASNAICRRAGFELVGETEFEYPPGSLMRSHDWRYDLRGA